MKFAFSSPPVPSVAIAGTELHFPVHRIYCVGRNYAEHAREMGFDPDREPPFFFTKPCDAVVASGSTIRYARATHNLHHEIELVIAIGKGAPIRPKRGARSRLRLRRWHRSDAAGSTTRRARQGTAVGCRQGFRRIGADQQDPPRRRNRAPAERRNLAEGERREPASRGPEEPLVAGCGRHRPPVAIVRAKAGRSDLHGDTGGCRSRRARGSSARRGGRNRRSLPANRELMQSRAAEEETR